MNHYRIVPGRHIEIIVVAPDGGRALVVGTVDVTDHANDVVMGLRVTASHVTALPAAVRR